MIKPDRRTFIVSATAAAAAFGLNGTLEFLPSARAEELVKQGFYKMKVGDAEIITVHDGHFNKPIDESFVGNASVAEIKDALKAAGTPGDAVTIPFTITFARIGGKTIMFDSGTGAQLAPTAGKLAANMKAAGISKDEIDTVIVTHFHPDHIFGLMEKGTNAQVFPNAEIIVPETEYAFWTDAGKTGSLNKGLQGLAGRIQATFPSWKNITQFSGDKEVTPGIRAITAHGHTPGHTVFQIASGDKEALVLADTANVPALFVRNPGWQVAFDMSPDKAEAMRRKLFDRVAADKSTITGYHFGMPGAGRIEKDGKGYVYVPTA
ncbi:MAG: MBL fold metallo-hydrolase [Filomicrobium sp.]